jgi:hypothetical protein
MRKMLSWAILLVSPVAFHAVADAKVGTAAPTVSSHGPLYVRSYIGKCLTYGQMEIDPASGPDPSTSPVILPSAATDKPVYIDDCNTRRGLPAPIEQVFQRIVVEEINERHEVTLRAGNSYIGVVANVLIERVPLELQDFNGGPGQVFVLDGDSIILAADRELVVEVRNGKGANGTPLVLGRRDLNDSEFWDFTAADGTPVSPTDGFVRVHNATELETALAAAGWGTVIQVEQTGFLPFDLTTVPTLVIPNGVTIRGNRRGILPGPELSAKGATEPDFELKIDGNRVRITGLRLTGPSRSKGTATFDTGIFVKDSFISTIIDNNDMSAWTSSAVNVFNEEEIEDWACSTPDEIVRPENVHVVRNFIHHNAMDDFGYGVVVGGDGFAGIVGNTFLMNRHAIAADGTAQSGYSAWYNLVLSNVPSYGTQRREQADFDMHGSDLSSGHTGGIGGGQVEIARNTFLGSNRQNFDLRGMACGSDRFVNNVSQQSKGDGLRWYVPKRVPPCEAELTTRDRRVVHRWFCGFQTSPPSTPPAWLEISDNSFDASNPTARLGVGDFDGDGRDDTFLATGQAWYFSPGGAAEWRYLNAQTDRIATLRFGDFDGDGRTDVFTKHGNDLVVSWGGLSAWEKINESDHSLNDYALGDFDGDGRADVFYANGSQWFVSYGGVSAFIPYAVSSYRVSNLRFGDFNADKKTDVFGVVSGYWQVVYGGTDSWAPLRPALTDSVTGLVVADFDGDGRADVGSSRQAVFVWVWRVSRSGTSGWTPVHIDFVPLAGTVGIGRFDDLAGADAITWGHNNSLAFDIVSSAQGAFQRWSTQEMR